MIPRIEAAHRALSLAGNRGDYTVWPGPNSNSFIAWLTRHVPGA